MTQQGTPEKYDVVFIGTGMIPVLEAVYQSLCGKSVLIVDQQHDFGGAWLPIEIFGLHNVENAIHYLLPDEQAPAFMRDVLKWDVIKSPRKYRIFDLPLIGCVKFPYDSALGRALARLVEGLTYSLNGGVWQPLQRALAELRPGARQPSLYVQGGAIEMLKKVEAILAASNVKVRYSTPVQAITVDTPRQLVEIETPAGNVQATAIVFSHGSKIKNLRGPDGPYEIVDKLFPRPAMHLLVHDTSPPDIYEAIFTADPLIKYAHDITRFTQEAETLKAKKKVIVLALTNGLPYREKLGQEIFEKLKWSGMLGPQAALEDEFWSDVYLPTLEDCDLENIKSAFGSQVQYLRTENFAAGIGYYCDRWASKIKFPAQHA